MPKFLLRLISFPSKEIWEVLRQPRLVLSLIPVSYTHLTLPTNREV